MVEIKIRNRKIEFREYDDYKEYLNSEAKKKGVKLSTLVQDALRKVHPMPKNWKPKQ